VGWHEVCATQGNPAGKELRRRDADADADADAEPEPEPEPDADAYGAPTYILVS
jgi:hypothetical protein